MTFEAFAAAVADIAGDRGSVASQEVRRYAQLATELRWTAWVEFRPCGLMVDAPSPEAALDELRLKLSGPMTIEAVAS